MIIIRTCVRQSQGGVRPLSSPNWSVHSIRRALTTLRAHLWSLWIRLSFINHDRNHDSFFFFWSPFDFSNTSRIDTWIAPAKFRHALEKFPRACGRLSFRGRQDVGIILDKTSSMDWFFSLEYVNSKREKGGQMFCNWIRFEFPCFYPTYVFECGVSLSHLKRLSLISIIFCQARHFIKSFK